MSPSVISYAGPQIRIPSSPTVSFFAELAHNEALRIAMCEHTFKSVSLKNNEIYGEETRVNEVFLRQTLTTGLVPVSVSLHCSFIEYGPFLAPNYVDRNIESIFGLITLNLEACVACGAIQIDRVVVLRSVPPTLFHSSS